jgi:prepilin-type N-terminal cleavage/methylation domain-containing protein
MLSRNKKKSNLGFKKGVTLIELISVIAIIGIIATVSWVTMIGTKNSANAQNACEQVAAMINKTRNYALSGKVVGVSVPDKFRFGIINSNNAYIDDNIMSQLDYLIIPNGVLCSNVSFLYSVPYGNCSGTANCDMNIDCLSGGASRTVTVTPNSAVCN